MYHKGLVTTLAELEDFYKGQAAGDLIELMSQTNDILSDMAWMESNMGDGHLTRLRTALPEVYWARLYKGVPVSKGQWTQVKEGTGRLKSTMDLDVDEVMLYGDRARAFRMSEARGFTEAMRQKVAHTLFYGDTSKNPEAFNGFASRYRHSGAKGVIDAGGTGARLTSLYFISWGGETCHGIFPKGSTGGLMHEDKGRIFTADGDGNPLEVYRDTFTWCCGLAVRDWRSVARIANIDLDNPPDLQELTIIAKNNMPESMRQKGIWYGNKDVLTLIERESVNKSNVHLTYGEYFGSKNVPALHGRPLRQCDAIASDEARVLPNS